MLLKIVSSLSYKRIYAILALLLFLALLPISYNIDFYQNDDWVYYLNTEWFANGNFQLHQYLGPTFFLQGIIGAVFSKIFGLGHLPILTLFLASINFYIVAIICTKYLKRSFTESLLGAFLFFVTPINMYLVWGFMTCIYFLFFLLVCIYLFMEYESTNKIRYLLFIYMLSFLALLIRQTSLIIPLSIGIYYLFPSGGFANLKHFLDKWSTEGVDRLSNIAKSFSTTKRSMLGLVSILVFLAFFGFLNYIFPLTAVMKRASLQYHHLSDFKYLYALTYGSILTVVAYLFPLFLFIFDIKLMLKNKLQFLLFLLFSGLLFVLLNKYFYPDIISWGEFPYFENTVERTGFYPRGVHGTKYQFIGNFDLYRFWDLGAKVLTSLVISYLLVYKKLKLNFFVFLIATYVFVLNLTETHYDRYLLVLLPLTVFYIYSISPPSTLYTKLFLGFFILFMTLLMYQFSMDFYYVNKYIWNKSKEIVLNEGIPESAIHGTNAWKLLYRNEARAYTYIFSYDSQAVNNKLIEQYTLIETHEITYPLNFFINSKIYLYKHK